MVEYIDFRTLDEWAKDLLYAFHDKVTELQDKYSIEFSVEDGVIICRGYNPTECEVNEFYSEECAKEFEEFFEQLGAQYSVEIKPGKQRMEIHRNGECLYLLPSH